MAQAISSKEVGGEYQPAAFVKMMKNLFLVFKQKGIQFTMNDDFNGSGQFHGHCKAKWIELKKKDPKFGTQQRKAQFDIDIDSKCRMAIVEGILDIWNTPKHLTMAVQFTFGRYCAFWGVKEHHDLTHNCVHRGVYSDLNGGPELNGLAYCGIKLDNDKMNQLGFNNPTPAPDSTHLLTFVEEPKDEVFNPVQVMDFYIDHCHPEAVMFFAAPGTPKQIAKWSKQFGKPIWYGPAIPTSSAFKAGEKMINTNFKEWARLSGCPNWEDCSGHGVRSLAITLTIQMDFLPRTQPKWLVIAASSLNWRARGTRLIALPTEQELWPQSRCLTSSSIPL